MSKLNSRFRKGVITVIGVAGLAAAAVVVAQPGPGFGPGMMGRGGPGMMMGNGHGPMFASNDADFAKFQQDRLAQLKSQLGITAEQQSAWDAFVAQAAEQAKTMHALRKNATAGTMPERMQSRQKAMGTMIESLSKLYEVLTPQQRAVFDKSHGPMHRFG